MKKFTAIIVFLAIILQTLNQVVIIAEYYARKDYIAKNLCENKNKPGMHCEGKCCLKKKLAKEGKEQGPTPRSQKSEEVTLFYADMAVTIPHHTFPLSARKFYTYNDLSTFSFPHSVFHPPAA